MTTPTHGTTDTPGGGNGAPPVQVTQTTLTTITPADVLAALGRDIENADGMVRAAWRAMDAAKRRGDADSADHHRHRVAFWAHKAALHRANYGIVLTASPEG